MKKVFAFGTVALSAVLLSGCFGGNTSEAFEKNVQAAKDAATAKDIDAAFMYISAAYEENPKEAEDNYQAVAQKKYTNDLEKANLAIKQGKFEEAEEIANGIQGIWKEAEPGELEELIKLIAETKVKQQKLDAYVEWLEPVLEQQSAISTEWIKRSQAFKIQQIRVEDFAHALSQLLPKTEQLVNDVNHQAIKLETDLSTIHETFAENVRKNHDDLVNTLSYANENALPSKQIADEGRSLNQIGANQAAFVQSLRNYAEKNNMVVRLGEK